MAVRHLGIEFSADRLAIVEVGLGRRLKVFNFAVIDCSAVTPARRIEQLLHTLKVRGFEANDAILTIAGDSADHSAPAVLHALEWFTQTSIKIRQVTTVMESISNLARCANLGTGDAPSVIAHFSQDRLSLVLVNAGVLLSSRETKLDFDRIPKDTLVKRLITEIKQPISWFRQTFPQLRIGQILFSGTGTFLRALADQCKEELGVDTGFIQYEDHLDLTSFRGDWLEFRQHLPSLSAAIGAAWSTPVAGQKKRGAQIIAGTAVAAIALFTTIAGIYFSSRTTNLSRPPEDLKARPPEVQSRITLPPDVPQLPALAVNTTPGAPPRVIVAPRTEPPQELPKQTLPAYQVNAIISNARGSWAVIDSQVFRVGDPIGVETVRQITTEAVALAQNGSVREVQLSSSGIGTKD